MKKKILIATIIATCNRPKLLQNRALKSVQLQVRKPDYLIVVDDSDRKLKPLNEEIVSNFRCASTKIIYLENYRTKGASGAWNTAFSELLKRDPDVYISILDDDDEWNLNYLKLCEDLILKADLDMVISGIIRYDDANPDGIELTIPDHLKAKDFLIGNPNVQGSNLFIKLLTILEAGGFDESLSSTTDRDMCIRIADLGYVKIGVLKKHLVNHYAFSEYERLSTFASPQKIQGLNTFFNKYSIRMSKDQKRAFLERAKNLFGFQLNNRQVRDFTEIKKPRHNSFKQEFNIIIGFISSSLVDQTIDLLKDINRITALNSKIIKKVVILENSGISQINRNKLRELLKSNYTFDLEIYSLENQESDIKCNLYGKKFNTYFKERGIAFCRTILQGHLFRVAKHYINPIVWILDDDLRLRTLYWEPKKGYFNKIWDFFDEIKQLKLNSVDVGLCSFTGAPPLPTTSCIRTQMVDLYHNLERLLNLDPDDSIKNLEILNQESREKFTDYYYDLSRTSTKHLEFPFWFNDDKANNARSLFESLINHLKRILKGEQVFRPLIADPSIDPFKTIIPSINRGGNTFIFNLDVLRDFPNYLPMINGNNLRRSDMVWCLLNRFISDRKIIQIDLPVTHDRSKIEKSNTDLDFDKLKDDFLGYAIYSALYDIFKARTKKGQIYHLKRYNKPYMSFSSEEKTEFKTLYRKYYIERYTAFELSYHRIMGIVKMIKLRFLFPKFRSNVPWWLNDPSLKNYVNSLHEFVMFIENSYKKLLINDFKKGFEEISENDLDDYLSNLFEIVLDFHNATNPE